MTYEVHLDELKNKQTALNGQKGSYDGLSTELEGFDGSEIAAIVSATKTNLSKLEEGYPQICDWLDDYLSELDNVESGLTSHAEIADFTGAFENIFAAYVAPTIKEGGDKTANILTEDHKSITGYGNMDTSRILNNGATIEVPFYAQGSGEAWANMSYGDNVVSTDGCSITSMAMVFSYLLKDNITPDILISDIEAAYGYRNAYFAYGTGMGWEGIPAIGDLYDSSGIDIEFSEIGGSNYSGIKQSLEYGNPVIVSNPELTGCGHYFVLTGYDAATNRVYVNDPSSIDRSSVSYDFNYLMSHNNDAWACSIN